MDWMSLANAGFQNQAKNSPLVDTKTLSPMLTPEELRALNEKIKANNGGSFLQEPTTAVPTDPNMLTRLPATIDMTSPEDRALTNDLRSIYKRLVPQVETGIEQQKQNIADIRNTPQGIDFSPMAALADKWSGGGNQLSTAAQNIKGMSDKEKLSLLMQGQNAVQDDQKALLTEIGSKLASKDNMKLLEAQMKNQRMLAGQDFTLAKDFNKNIREDVKPYYEIMPSIGAVQAALTPDASGGINVQRLTQALSNSSRLLGEKGVLTDQDISRVQKNTFDMYLAQLSALAGDPSATVPASQVAPLIRAIQEGQAAWQNSLQKKLATTNETYQAMGLNPAFTNKVAQDIYGKGLVAPASPTAEQTKPKLKIEDLLKD